MSDDIPDSDGVLYKQLREWRSEQSRELKLPAYCLFSDKVLVAIAGVRPRTMSELMRVSGVGPAKADKYGVDVLRIVGEAER